MINVPLIQDVNIIEITLILAIIGLITTIGVLNLYHWKQRSKNFKIISRIISVPLVFLTCITTACLIIPYEALNKLHRPILIHLAQNLINNNVIHYGVKYSFFVVGLIFLFNLYIYGLRCKGKHGISLKRTPHLVYTIISAVVLVGLTSLLLSSPSMFEKNLVIQNAYKYHTSRIYHRRVNHVKPRNKAGKKIKYEIQHDNGVIKPIKHIKN